MMKLVDSHIIIIVLSLNPILARSSRKPPDPPPSTRTTNKKLNVESFMTKMMMKLYQASSFKIYVLKSFGFNITHLSSSP